MPVKQREIAEKLDLSVTTVCRSLRGYADIHPGTRKKVVELASKLGYRPRFNSARRKGKVRSSQKIVSIGAMVSWPKNAAQNPGTVAYHMLSGISEEADKRNISLATQFLSPERRQRIAESGFRFPTVRAGGPSGMLLIYPFSHEIVREIAGHLPCVSIVNPYMDLGVDCIDNDHAAGIGLVVKHLYQLGHRRIGFLGTTRRQGWVFFRLCGYQQAMNQLSLPYDFSEVLNITGPVLETEAQVETIIEYKKRGVTAWVCADDLWGYRLYPQLISRGLRIPRDISIAGFTGLTPPGDCPQMTSVHPPYEQMGAAAMRRLISRIKHPSEPVHHIQFGCEFVKGETTGPPPEQSK